MKRRTLEEGKTPWNHWLSNRRWYERNDPPSDFWKECQARLKAFHTRQHSEDPRYMTDNFKEYRIKRDQRGWWKIYAYKGGYINPQVKGRWGSEKDAEAHLISFIRRNNITGHARYPGCPSPRQINYTELFLKDWSPKPRL